MSRFLSYGYVAATGGGLLLVLGAALALTGVNEPFSAQVVTTGFVVSSAIRLVAAVGMIIGLTAIFLRAVEAAGRLGLVAYTLVIANMILQAGWMWSDLFLTGALAENAPGLLDGELQDTRMTLGFLSAWLLNTSFALLGIAVLRSRVHPRVVGLGLVAMGAITLIPLPVDGPAYEMVIGLALAVAGYGAWRSRPSATLISTSAPIPVSDR
jgi:hypothetical protein